MPTIQGTIFFEQEGYGWTESLYKVGTDTDLRTYLPGLYTLATKRIKLSGAQTQIKHTRVSSVGIFRDVDGENLNLVGDGSHESDTPATALLIFMNDVTSLKHKFMFMRGIWDSVVKIGGLYQPTVAYSANFAAWRVEVVAGTWGWLGTATKIEQLVTNVVQNVDKTVTVTLAAELFPVPRPDFASVRISGVQGAVQLNGQQIVRVNSGTQFTTKFPVAMFPWTVGGKVTYNLKGFVAASGIGVERVTERKPGRPSYKSVGRRRARARS
jgi:hypothetical protein